VTFAILELNLCKKIINITNQSMLHYLFLILVLLANFSRVTVLPISPYSPKSALVGTVATDFYKPHGLPDIQPTVLKHCREMKVTSSTTSAKLQVMTTAQ